MGDLTILAEMASIEQTMRDAPSTYFHNEPMQARYRDLLDQRDGPADDGDGDDDPITCGELVPVGMREFDAADTWQSFDEYARAVSFAADVVLAVPSSERRSLVDSFNRLPDDVAGALACEMTNQTGTGYAPCSDAEVRAFSRETGGSIVREWGAEAQRTMGRVRGRLNRAMDSMDERGLNRFLDWLESLSDGQAVAVYRKLAS